MAPTLIDHLLVLVFVVLLPLRVAWGRRHPRRGGESRMHFYRRTLAMHVLLAASVLVTVAIAGHSARVTGMVVTDPIAMLLGMLAGLIALWLRFRLGVRALRDAQENPAPQLRGEPMRMLLPRTGTERAAFYWLSLVASFSEELLFRAYLLHFCLAFLPLPLAVSCAVVGFALAHLYQGWKGVLLTGVIGGALMLLYLQTGSIWAGVLFHAGFNMISGAIGGRLVTLDRPVARAPAD